jgi:hypothetical protein
MPSYFLLRKINKMPVFVEWKWEERAQSLLAIFHFYDDFSKPNLRLMERHSVAEPIIFGKRVKEANRSWITWAPSHTDMALLMQMLCYANIVNGLKPSEKRKLWIELEGKSKFSNEVYDLTTITVPDEIKRRIGSDKKVMAYGDPEDEEVYCTCVELCPEYIDHLRKLLKPYIK